MAPTAAMPRMTLTLPRCGRVADRDSFGQGSRSVRLTDRLPISTAMSTCSSSTGAAGPAGRVLGAEPARCGRLDVRREDSGCDAREEVIHAAEVERLAVGAVDARLDADDTSVVLGQQHAMDVIRQRRLADEALTDDAQRGERLARCLGGAERPRPLARRRLDPRPDEVRNQQPDKHRRGERRESMPCPA